MTSTQKATELIEKLGKEKAHEIANMIFFEHYNYADSNYIWRGNPEIYSNLDMCNYWNEVRSIIDLAKI